MSDEDLSQEEVDENNKALFQFQSSLINIMKPLRKYGQEDYVLMVVPEIVSLAYQLHIKLHGADIPFTLSDHMQFMLPENEQDD